MFLVKALWLNNVFKDSCWDEQCFLSIGLPSFSGRLLAFTCCWRSTETHMSKPYIL